MHPVGPNRHLPLGISVSCVDTSSFAHIQGQKNRCAQVNIRGHVIFLDVLSNPNRPRLLGGGGREWRWKGEKMKNFCFCSFVCSFAAKGILLKKD